MKNKTGSSLAVAGCTFGIAKDLTLLSKVDRGRPAIQILIRYADREMIHPICNSYLIIMTGQEQSFLVRGRAALVHFPSGELASARLVVFAKAGLFIRKP
ncbi:hypothetical protein ACFFSY_33090 [Paenibacillus aurantiacus]|uniref:Uncharacterized protein n=1 Tax=Paenibacillus aurantiacus TaxID=1936118 RepID=A0ABV5L3E9_9BACL